MMLSGVLRVVEMIVVWLSSSCVLNDIVFILRKLGFY